MKRAMFLALLFCVGCGGDGDGDGGGGGTHPPAGGSSHACTTGSGDGKSCIEYPGAYPVDQARQVCTTGGGSFSTGGCSHSDLAGSCSISSGGATATVYYYAPVTTDDARMSCEVVHGSFTAGSGGGKKPSPTSCTDDDGQTVAAGGVDSRVRYRAASVPAGQTCESETQSRTCTGGSWSAWSGSFTATSCSVAAAPKSCGGVATACSALSQSSCYSQSGCSYERGGCQGSTSSYSCSQFTWYGQSTCNNIPDCYWIGSSCSGTGYYDILSESECSRLAPYLTATWVDPGCKGTAASCDSFSGEFSCGYQQGCRWQ